MFAVYGEILQEGVTYMTVSELLRRSVMERIEDELDLKTYEEAMAEYKKNPVTYTLDEVIEEQERRFRLNE